MKNVLLLSVFVSLFINGRAQSPGPAVTLADLRFTSVFAHNNKDSLHSYCLLGNQFFMARHARNTGALVRTWVASHPRARIIPIVTYYSFTPTRPGARQTYCWLVDNKDTINTYLIRNGCFEANTMCRPHTGAEMNKVEKELYNNITLHIDSAGYWTFVKQIRGAEAVAKKNKRGIWKR